ncbi:MAG: hypothetical protein QNJ98_04085 [Planctomycetota bacterium]|nr:hypothetical protein [Planctomycetota bacterium]
MRAHRARRTIWILNLVLGTPLCLLAAGLAVEAAAEARAAPGADQRLPAARHAVRGLDRALRDATAVRLGASVANERVDRVFHVADDEVWIPFSGPVQPPPPPPPPREEPTTPALEDHGRAQIVMWGPGVAQLTFRFNAGGAAIVKAGEWLEVPGTSLRFRLVRIERTADDRFRIVYVTAGSEAEQAFIVSTRREARPGDPIRPVGPIGAERPAVPDPRAAAPAAPSEGRLEIQVVEQGSRRIVRMGPQAFEQLRGPAGERLLQEVKTREVRLPGGGAGVQLRWIGEKATVLHKVKLANGDVLISVNGTPTPTRGTLMELVRGLPEGTRRVTVEVDRNSRRLRYEIEVPAGVRR